MMALLLQMQARTLLQAQAVRKKRYKSAGVSGKKFLSNKVILQEQFQKNMGDMAVSQIF